MSALSVRKPDWRDIRKENVNRKRKNYINWEEYFMGIALLSGQRSKDPNTQVGACIVNEHKRIVGVGYNGFPDRCSDDELSWEKSTEKDEAGNIKNKHLYVCHAEMNAIINKLSVDIRDCTMYTTLYPCNECAKIIIQSGLRKVVYKDRKDDDGKDKASEAMFKLAEVETKKYVPARKMPLIIGEYEFLL